MLNFGDFNLGYGAEGTPGQEDQSRQLTLLLKLSNIRLWIAQGPFQRDWAIKWQGNSMRINVKWRKCVRVCLLGSAIHFTTQNNGLWADLGVLLVLWRCQLSSWQSKIEELLGKEQKTKSSCSSLSLACQIRGVLQRVSSYWWKEQLEADQGLEQLPKEGWLTGRDKKKKKRWPKGGKQRSRKCWVRSHSRWGSPVHCCFCCASLGPSKS